jgi:hypothetical protein
MRVEELARSTCKHARRNRGRGEREKERESLPFIIATISYVNMK